MDLCKLFENCALYSFCFLVRLESTHERCSSTYYLQLRKPNQRIRIKKIRIKRIRIRRIRIIRGRRGRKWSINFEN